MKLILLIEAFLCLLFSCVFIVSCLSNAEYKPAIRFTPIGIITPSTFLIVAFTPDTNIAFVLIRVLISIIPALVILHFLIPFNKIKKYPSFIPPQAIDERDTLFSRVKLKFDTTQYKEYYQRYPEREKIDLQIKKYPGLLNQDARYYNQMAFASTKATFKVIDHLHSMIDKKPLNKKRELDKEQTKSFIKTWMNKLGAHSIGIAELKNHHFYTVGGRGDRYNKKRNNNHKYGICFTMEMDYDMVQSAPKASIVMESSEQYLKGAIISIQIAELIKQLGYEARVHMDGDYELMCNMVAKDAGLGEIGRMGLLITPKLGPRVRIGVISTNMPLSLDEPTHDDSILNFCSKCKKCVLTCPSKAIKDTERKSGEGWGINREKCFEFWCKSGTDCGRCMAICPYGHKNNPLHELVKCGIRRSQFFQHYVIRMDNYLYGRKPKPKKLPEWIP